MPMDAAAACLPFSGRFDGETGLMATPISPLSSNARCVASICACASCIVERLINNLSCSLKRATLCGVIWAISSAGASGGLGTTRTFDVVCGRDMDGRLE